VKFFPIEEAIPVVPHEQFAGPRAHSKRRSGALEHLERWLTDHDVPGEEARLVVERVKDFYADASVLLHFPAALGITGTPEPRAVRLHLIWPAAVPLSERAGHQEQLRALFDRDLSAPLASSISCELAFTERLPQRRGDYDCYIGPNPTGYQGIVETALATKRAVERAPHLAQEIVDLVQSYPEKTEGERREVADRLRDLAAQLRST
jgi:hypothetical protein